MKKTSVLIVLALLLASCASAPTTPAPWDASPAAIRQVFPDSGYIAQRGRGAIRAAAEADGAAQIALFFNAQIGSQTRIAEQYSERNGRAQSNTEIETETFVRSQMNLFGIRYARDAYFDRQMREWITVAYIDRAEAWQVYGPRFKQQAEAFQGLFLAAENESDPFRKALRFIAAGNYAGSPDFQNADAFGQFLYPAKMNEEFALVRSQAASLPQKTDNARRNASVYIDCPDDFESLIYNAFSREFSSLGFPVSANRNAAALCSVAIESGEQIRDLGIFYHPSLQAVLTGPSGVLWTFTAEAERTAAVTPDVAKRRAYQALAEAVSRTFNLAGGN
jgi:hypothetical protein